jgi:hypothetical protein
MLIDAIGMAHGEPRQDVILIGVTRELGLSPANQRDAQYDSERGSLKQIIVRFMNFSLGYAEGANPVRLGIEIYTKCLRPPRENRKRVQSDCIQF